jgi:Peroxidase
MLIIKASFVFLATLAYVGVHVKACPYLEGENGPADRALLMNPLDQVPTPHTRGAHRYLQSKDKDRVRVSPNPIPFPAAAATPPTRSLASLSTAQLIAAARTEIVTAIAAAPERSGMAAKLVRLSFHDCVGGCDGCVDMSNLDNRGLDTPINVLRPIVTKNTGNTPLTRADIWALAGLTAAGNAQESTSVAFPLTLIGRPVCANFPNGTAATRAGPKRTMPSAHLTSQQLVNFFSTGFGFTADETVAIMGAHTL